MGTSPEQRESLMDNQSAATSSSILTTAEVCNTLQEEEKVPGQVSSTPLVLVGEDDYDYGIWCIENFLPVI